MKKHLVLTAALFAQSAIAQSTDEQWVITKKHDDEVRARNSENDFFLVSTVKERLSQARFYIDRNTIRDADAHSIRRAWVESYEVIGHKQPIRMRQVKMFVEVRCAEDLPQMRFRTVIAYEPNGSTQSESGPMSWQDVIPGSSMETQHRFICHPQPANAIYPVFGGNTPENDALAYFAQRPQ